MWSTTKDRETIIHIQQQQQQQKDEKENTLQFYITYQHDTYRCLINVLYCRADTKDTIYSLTHTDIQTASHLHNCIKNPKFEYYTSQNEFGRGKFEENQLKDNQLWMIKVKKRSNLQANCIKKRNQKLTNHKAK